MRGCVGRTMRSMPASVLGVACLGRRFHGFRHHASGAYGRQSTADPPAACMTQQGDPCGDQKARQPLDRSRISPGSTVTANCEPVVGLTVTFDGSSSTPPAGKVCHEVV